MDYLRLVRYKNLIFIASVMILMQFCIVKPIENAFGFASDDTSLMPDYIFWMLTAATVLISAGGYAINDYFDTKIDLLNKPDRLIVGRTITKDQASMVHHVTTGLGAIIGIVAAILLRNLTTGFIFVMVPGLLWFYSASYKRQMLIGNVVIALLAGTCPLLLAIANHAYLNMDSNFGELINQTPMPKAMYSVLCVFGLFAFLLTLVREIIKDMQDEYGDRESECRTIPVVIGTGKTKFIVYALIAITAFVAVYVSLGVPKFPLLSSTTTTLTGDVVVAPGSFALRYALVGVVAPLIALAILIIRAKTPDDYKNASTLTKFIMAVGALFAIVFYYMLAKAQGLVMFGLFVVAQQ